MIYKIGDNFKQMTLDYYQWLNDGNDEKDFIGKEYYETTIKYISPNGGLILEIVEPIVDDSFETSLFKGSEIKEVYSDFNGDDDKKYCVLYEENSPFFR